MESEEREGEGESQLKQDGLEDGVGGLELECASLDISPLDAEDHENLITLVNHDYDNFAEDTLEEDGFSDLRSTRWRVR